jgi:5-dehydro-2-deoxygluconokinase
VALDPHLDVITIGRSSVDLYGAQVGGRLEDMATFSKAVGGCPTNIAIGTARLGLKSGLITRVGDEHMGRFIREQCAREGVDVAGIRTDPVRLTSLVLLGIRDEKTFPLISIARIAPIARSTRAISILVTSRAPRRSW